MVAEAKEEANKLTKELVASEPENGAKKTSGQETGCGKEVEDGGSPAVENANENQKNQPVEETPEESSAIVAANDHTESDEQNPHGEKTEVDGTDGEHSDKVAADAVNGEAEVKEEAEFSASNEVKGSTESGSDEVTGEINVALDITADSANLKKDALADVVLKANIANGTGDKDTAVNGITESVSAKTIAEE